MRIETALRKRDAATAALVDLYSRAEHFGMESSAINEAFNSVLANLDGAPRWTRDYLNGYRAALTAALYRDALVYGAFINGRFHSTHRARPDYYEKLGVGARAFAEANLVKGHYWAESLRPFFTSRD